jgi:hypothetical protein
MATDSHLKMRCKIYIVAQHDLKNIPVQYKSEMLCIRNFFEFLFFHFPSKILDNVLHIKIILKQNHFYSSHLV